MVMVTPMERSQWRAAAVPCAWKARRMGCEAARRGGSVVLEVGGQYHGSSRVADMELRGEGEGRGEERRGEERRGRGEELRTHAADRGGTRS